MKKAVLLLMLILNSYCYSQITIKDIYIDRRDVFDSTDADWFFAAPVINSFHTLTKQYVIEDELLFKSGDELNLDFVYETERNLRNTGLFSNVDIQFDSAGYNSYDIWVITQDRWSTMPEILFGTGGKEHAFGLGLKEKNFLGTGSKIQLDLLYRSENKTGWQITDTIALRRFLRSDYSIEFSIFANKHKTAQNLQIYDPFLNISDKSSYGISLKNEFGNDFSYYDDKTNLLPIHERRLKLWYSYAWKRKDRVFMTVMSEFDDVKRIIPEYRRAYDNTAKLFVAFSSLSESYIETDKLNTFNIEDLPIGGWGTTILGKTFAMNSDGEALYYIGGRGETSWLYGNLYLFGQLTGASSFTNNHGKFTYQEFLGLGFYRITKDILLTGRFCQQTVWNWNAYRQLVLDNDAGLRGYTANRLSGDNRIVGNIELRTFPNINLWILRFGPTLFFDVGTVWNKGIDIDKTRWHSSIGAGLRIFNMKSEGKSGVIRIDVAYNFDERKFAEIILTSDQLFSVFKQHIFNLPEVFGMEFDYE